MAGFAHFRTVVPAQMQQKGSVRQALTDPFAQMPSHISLRLRL
jgi:hypothetical protein